MPETEMKREGGQPPQHQEREPGVESRMTPQPKSENREHKGSDKLKDRVALITSGDRAASGARRRFCSRAKAQTFRLYI